MNIKKVKDELIKNGIVFLRNYMSNSKEIGRLIGKLHILVSNLAKRYNLKVPGESIDEIEMSICQLNDINNKIGGYLNDSLNASPELYQLFLSDKIEKLATQILEIEKGSLLSNNYRLRIQIPKRDEVSNLPWHQDSHYNNLYNHNQSIVIWISLSDINLEKGPIIFKKGSHKLKKIEVKDWIRPNGARVFSVPKKYIEDEEYVESSFETKKGDIILIDMNLIHKSGYNKSDMGIKLSSQARFHNLSAEGFLDEYF